jgi:arginyl-tRNA synthetase
MKTVRDKIKKLLRKEIGEGVELEHPRDSRFGDYSTNIALVKKIDPQKIVERVKKKRNV